MQAAKARTALGTALVKRIAAPARVAVGLLGLVGIAVSGCGDDGDGGGGDTSRFLGSWRYTAGQITPKCNFPEIDSRTLPLTGATMDVAIGATSDLSAVRLGCALKLDVKGSEAAAQKGQSCSSALPVNGIQAMAKVDLASWKLKTTDGQTATTEGSGTGIISLGPLMVPCNFTETGTLVRASADAGAR